MSDNNNNNNETTTTNMKNEIKTTQIKTTAKLGRRFKAVDLVTGAEVIISDGYSGNVYTFPEMHAFAAQALRVRIDEANDTGDELVGIQLNKKSFIWNNKSATNYADVSNHTIGMAKERGEYFGVEVYA